MSELPPFQALLDEHGADLHRFLVGSVGSHAASDCFQETVLAALRGYDSLRNAENLRGWLFTIAYRKIIDRHRAESKHGDPTPVPPERVHLDGERDPELWANVRSLPPKQSTAVLQRFLLDRPYAEIAVVIGCSEDAARQNVRAGLSRLREVMS